MFRELDQETPQFHQLITNNSQFSFRLQVFRELSSTKTPQRGRGGEGEGGGGVWRWRAVVAAAAGGGVAAVEARGWWRPV